MRRFFRYDRIRKWNQLKFHYLDPTTIHNATAKHIRNKKIQFSTLWSNHNRRKRTMTTTFTNDCCRTDCTTTGLSFPGRSEDAISLFQLSLLRRLTTFPAASSTSPPPRSDPLMLCKEETGRGGGKGRSFRPWTSRRLKLIISPEIVAGDGELVVPKEGDALRFVKWSRTRLTNLDKCRPVYCPMWSARPTRYYHTMAIMVYPFYLFNTYLIFSF